MGLRRVISFRDAFPAADKFLEYQGYAMRVLSFFPAKQNYTYRPDNLHLNKLIY
jgi:hypothetical protein